MICIISINAYTQEKSNSDINIYGNTGLVYGTDDNIGIGLGHCTTKISHGKNCSYRQFLGGQFLVMVNGTHTLMKKNNLHMFH